MIQYPSTKVCVVNIPQLIQSWTEKNKCRHALNTYVFTYAISPIIRPVVIGMYVHYLGQGANKKRATFPHRSHCPGSRTLGLV